jgi:hypothetical protein
MKSSILSLCFSLLFLTVAAQDFITPFEASKGKQSATYFEAIDFYKRLASTYSKVRTLYAGPSDANYPLHVVLYCADRRFNPQKIQQQNKLVVLVNNGIHPGEPDGIDASMMLMRDVAEGKIKVPKEMVLAVVPVFNIGGALNRGSVSRVNQNGPEEYGFRGNAQNLDLNRDFIKMDAKETQSLVELFHHFDPAIFIDNHVSNGADYQHVMTLLTMNEKKQGTFLGKYLSDSLLPTLYKNMKQKGYDLVPYVNHFGNTPDSGWQQFYEPPRFASGFAALFQTLAFVPETHMLKPYDQRVKATYELMETIIAYAATHMKEIKEEREKERRLLAGSEELVLDWKADSQKTMIDFKGYEAAYKESKVSGQPRLYYDRSKPYTKKVPFYNHFIPTALATAPKYYVVPQGWHKVIGKLKTNEVEMTRLEKDTTMELSVYRIVNYETIPKPFEGHYLHKNVSYRKQTERVRLYKGDYLIATAQTAKRYLVETLEPNAPDAFFAWGFFDAILQQKGGYSDYVFEENAAQLLEENSALKKALDDKKATDSSFRKNGEAQLDFVYHHSPFAEPEFMRYPVFRIE